MELKRLRMDKLLGTQGKGRKEYTDKIPILIYIVCSLFIRYIHTRI